MDDNRGGRTNAAEAALSVAVIGPGTMGAAVTRRLLGAGPAVNVWGRHPRRALDLAGAGAVVFDDPKDAVSTASVVLTWLPTAAAVDDVMVGFGVLDAMAPRAVWAQMGTIGVEATERLGAYAAARRPDVGFVDAPVAAAITRRWEALVDRGLGALDVSAARLGLGTARGVPDGHSNETLTGRPRDEQHRGRREEQPEGGDRGDRAQ